MKRTTPTQTVLGLPATWTATLVLALLFVAAPVPAQDAPASDAATPQKTPDQIEAEKAEKFKASAAGIHKRLEEATAELSKLREEMAADLIPLSTELSNMEQQLKDVRREYQKLANTSASRALEAGNLERTIKAQEDTAVYLSNFMDDFIRKMEAGLHVSEAQRFGETINQAKLVMENRSLGADERYGPQLSALDMALGRLEDALGGVMFDGTAVDPGGRVETGAFMLFGPVATFMSDNGEDFGLVDKAQGSSKATVIPYADPLMAEQAKKVLQDGQGVLPLDTTLGNARIIEATEETLLDEIKAGGPVMYPIFGLAGLALLIALYKWVSITLTPNPSKKRLAELLHFVSKREPVKAAQAAKRIKGPSGRMLQAGVENLMEPRELIEEVMYEQVLTTRLKVQRMLPFIAICAAAAPLLGLLGTVSGIINTFNMMKVFDSSDMKNVSGGISEALITTKFGLIVAIPALLLHAFLSRKARGVIDQMEKAGVAFINQVMKTPPNEGDPNPAKPKDGLDPDTDPAPSDADSEEGQGEDTVSEDAGEGSEAESEKDKQREPEPVLAQTRD